MITQTARMSRVRGFPRTYPPQLSLRRSMAYMPILPRRSAVRILIVEDNGDSAMLLAYALKEKGHEVTSVATADDALERCAAEPFDLLILDIGLPECDGWE